MRLWNNDYFDLLNIHHFAKININLAAISL